MGKRGKFVVIEGPEHCGKTTVIKALRDLVKFEPDAKVMFTREPGGTQLGDQIRTILLSKDSEIDPLAEAYLYAASRAQHVVQINKWLDEGYTVISDRFVYSSYAYQGIARGLGVGTIFDINKVALQDIIPDYIFYLQIDMDTYRARKRNITDLDRIELEGEEFFQKILNGYDDMLLEDPYLSEKDILRVIDATRSVDEVRADVVGQFTQFLKED